MLGPGIVVVVIVILVAVLVTKTGGRSRRGGGSTAGHFDPNAIGQYTLDLATMRYRYQLPTQPRASAPTVRDNAPPHGRRRRRRRTDLEGG